MLRSLFTPVAAIVFLAIAAPLLFVLTTSDRERALALNTLMLAAGTCAISLPLGTFAAVLLARCDVPGRKIFIAILALLLFVPLYVQNAAWQAGFGQQGWWELLFSRLGAPPPLDRWRGAIWIHAAAATPWVAFIVGAALRQVEPQMEEAALIEGSLPAVVGRVTLRRCAAAIFAAALWISVVVAGEITVTDMWQLRTYAEEVYIGFALGDTLEEVTLNVLPGIALVAWLTLAALLALAIVAPHGARPQSRAIVLFRLGAWRWTLFALLLLVVLLLAAVPLGNLIAKLGIVVEQHGAERVRSWSLSEAAAVLLRSPGEFHREILWSLIAGSFAATATVAVGIPLAWAACGRGVRKLAVLLPIALLVSIPGPVLGLGLVAIFNRPGVAWLNFLYDRSIAVVVVALAARALPLALLVIWYALESVPRATLEMAAVDGAGHWRRLWSVALPQRKLAIAAAWLVALAIAVGELSASFLVMPPGLSLLSRRIFEEAHYGVDNRLAGLTLVAIAVVSLVATTAVTLFRRQFAIVADE